MIFRHRLIVLQRRVQPIPNRCAVIIGRRIGDDDPTRPSGENPIDLASGVRPRKFAELRQLDPEHEARWRDGIGLDIDQGVIVEYVDVTPVGTVLPNALGKGERHRGVMSLAGLLFNTLEPTLAEVLVTLFNEHMCQPPLRGREFSDIVKYAFDRRQR